MTTINIAVTATNTQFSTFANELGYMIEVVSGTNPDSSPKVIPNPQTKQEFLMEFMKNSTVKQLSKVRLEVIDQEVRYQREVDKATVTTGIEGAVNVTVS